MTVIRALAYVKTLLAYACFIIRFKYMLVSSFHHSKEGLTLKMSAFLPFTVASLHFQLSCYTKLPAILSHQCSTTVSIETSPLYSLVSPCLIFILMFHVRVEELTADIMKGTNGFDSTKAKVLTSTSLVCFSFE